MSATASPIAKPFRPQFTLRRMLVVIFLLGIALGIGRWIYVRTFLQRQVVLELHSLEANVDYRWLLPLGHEKHLYSHWNRPPPLGYVADDVNLALPFASDAEAKRVNRLLAKLPYLRRVGLQTSSKHYRQSTAKVLCDRHAALALAELPIAELKINSVEVGPDLTAFVCRSPTLRSLSMGRTPYKEHFHAICQASQLESLQLQGALSHEHLEILATAEQLKMLRIWGELPYDRLGLLARLENCDVALIARKATDHEVEEYIARLPNLTQLSLSYSAPADEAVAALAASPRLERLDLEDAFISDRAIVSLAKSRSLKHVDLRHTDASQEAILQLAKGPSIKRIDVPHGLQSHDWRPLVPATVSISPSSPPGPDHTKRREQRRAELEAAKAAAAGTAKPLP